MRHEAAQLSLSIEKAQSMLDWQPRWGFETAVAETIIWYRDVLQGADPADLCGSKSRGSGFQKHEVHRTPFIRSLCH